ncbi:major facilitator superfamily domain-containing protein [Lipomyces japonicus]|uniref:major facilitator superfamily domain-containing protein n=1 Tax=Lipomyces japonicus TaxID=56871 RepID=UPI0034CEEB73
MSAGPSDTPVNGIIINGSLSAEKEFDPEKTEQESSLENGLPEIKFEQPETAPPDGGLVAWLQVSGSFILFMNSWGIVNTFGVFEAYYSSIHLSNKTPSDIAWIGSIQSFLLLLCSSASGPIFDRGYFFALTIFGSFFTVFGMMMLSLSTEYWQIMLSQAVCVGFGSGAMFVPSVAIIPQYFVTKRSFATGIAAAGSSFGGVIFPIIFHRLVGKIGFGWSTRVLAFIVLGTQVYAIAVMRVRTTPLIKRQLFDRSALSDSRFLLVTALLFFGFMGAYIPFYYVSSFATSKGIFNDQISFYLLPIMNAGSLFGRIAPNFTADKIGTMNVFVPATGLSMIVAFSWLAVRSKGGIILFAIAYGFVSGAFVSLPPSILAGFTKNIHVLGTRMGMAFAAAGFGVLIGTPVAGALLKTPKTYTAAILFGAFILLVAFLLSVACRIVKSGTKIFVKT